MLEHSEADQELAPVERKCKICHQLKTFEEFYWGKEKKMTKCKECHKDYVMGWRKKHLDAVKKHRNKYNEKYREETQTY